MILNRSIREDEEGEYTYTRGKKKTIIYYIIADGEMKDKIERMEIGDKTDSDSDYSMDQRESKKRR